MQQINFRLVPNKFQMFLNTRMPPARPGECRLPPRLPPSVTGRRWLRDRRRARHDQGPRVTQTLDVTGTVTAVARRAVRATSPRHLASGLGSTRVAPRKGSTHSVVGRNFPAWGGGDEISLRPAWEGGVCGRIFLFNFLKTVKETIDETTNGDTHIASVVICFSIIGINNFNSFLLLTMHPNGVLSVFEICFSPSASKNSTTTPTYNF